MSKKKAVFHVLTANRLGDGVVVFLDFEGAWNADFAAASIASTPDEARALDERGRHDAERNVVLEPYLVELHSAAGRLVPVRQRERVRIEGPSVLDAVPGYAAPILQPAPQAPSLTEAA